MRPALVLTIFEQHPTIGPLAYRSGGAFMPYTLLATEKKFSDAELAAEYWRSREDRAYIVEGITWEAMAGDWPVSEASALDREYVLFCLAELPHAAESDYE